MMYCTKCGYPLRADARFCVKCGTPVSIEPPQKSNDSQDVFLSKRMAQQSGKFEYMVIKVAGVTFNNPDGTSRQQILKKLDLEANTRNKPTEITFNIYKYEGKPAVAIYANGKMIGHVPKSQVQYFINNAKRIHSIEKLRISGGFERDDGVEASWGAEFTILLIK